MGTLGDLQRAEPDTLGALAARTFPAARESLARPTPVVPKAPILTDPGFEYQGPPDPPAEPVLSYEPFTLGPLLGRAAALPQAGRVLPWMLRAIPRQAVGFGVFGAAQDVAAGRNPLPGIPGNMTTGAIAGPAFEAGAGLVSEGVKGLARAVRPAMRKPVPTPVAALLEPPSFRPPAGLPQLAPGPSSAAAPRPSLPRQKLTGKSAQQFPGMGDVVSEIKADPAYLRRIDELGGGRVVSNKETVARAMEIGPMARNEIAAWKAGTPVNEVDVTRALITVDWHRQNWVRAVQQDNAEKARFAADAVREMLPGLENMRATPGRATQVQALFVQDKIAKTFEEIADLQAKGVPFDQMKREANEKMAAFTRDQSLRAAGNKVADWIGALEEYATRAKLTSPVTHAVNTVSNALTFFTLRPLEKVGRAGALALQGRGPESAVTLRTIFGTSSGFKSGMKKYITTLMDDALEPGKTEVRRTYMEFPRRLRPLDPFRQLSAADAFWKAIYQDSKLYERAYASARRQGLQGKALASRINELTTSPPATWLKQAHDEALEHTFQADPDKLLKSLGAVQNVPGMRLIIPFLKTPYNLMKYQFQRSPLGVVSPRNLQGLARGGEAQADAAGRLLAGSGLALGAWMIAKRGEITGAYPTDPDERAQWEAEGRPAYGIRVGDRWVQYNRFQPVGQYLAQAAALEDAVQAGDKEGVGALFTSLMASSGKAMLDMPFLQGMSSVLDALDNPKQYAEKFASGTVTGLVPNVLRDVRYQTDPVRREARGIGPALTNMIPGQSQNLPAKIDVLGREQRLAGSRLERGAKVVQESRETPETRALRASGFSPSEPRPALSAGKRAKGAKDVTLRGKDRETFEREMGEATRQAIVRVTADASFDRLDPEQQAERLQKAIEAARRPVRDRWKSETFNRGAAAGRR